MGDTKLQNVINQHFVKSTFSERRSQEIREVYDNDGIEGVVAFCRDNGGFEKFMLEDFSVFCYIVTLLWDEGLYVQIDDESGTAYITCGRNPDWERIADLYLHK